MQQRIAKFNRILKIREDSRKNEQAILAAERSEELEVMNHLTKLESEKNQAIKDFSSVGDKMISANDLWFQRQFIDAIDSDINKGKNALIDVRNRIIGTEARLVERHKDVKIMETYIDHLKELNFQEQLGIEQNELDDVATMQFSRKGVF
ncbi:MAG: flagellar FliJ family protein [Synergistaceae bacterium]|nr:flagellar FliJ family protein [Synergistaceae bacterium]MBQ6435708.1 flagellar FliJ family protein [Synergistaceae bacterium]MBQ6737475.1 flagellar FliJ family protein [Synergistaceae bacterium]MBQ7067662.1 flagellar FliJ family protein [Synergistaceae bacterium]MBR0075225.1 flagellar FliJ family protein [Synergistaceae bacterium]